jgi:F-type H+-transporting ATPase subunit gamma
VAERVDASIHPLLERREPSANSRTLIIIVSADKGLCGSFNTNIIKSAASFILPNPKACTIGLVGRKGRDYFGRRGYDVMFEQIGIFQRLRYDDARTIGQTAVDAFIAGSVDRVMLIYNEFKSVMTQRVVVEQLLPIARSDVEGSAASQAPLSVVERATVDYLYEPSAPEIFNQLLPRYIEVQIYRALLESNAAFFAAQMTAMDAASKNAADMIGNLTLYMNKVRQAAITREIIEVVSGAQAAAE